MENGKKPMSAPFQPAFIAISYVNPRPLFCDLRTIMRPLEAAIVLLP
jgi:hypothetical protein